MRKINGIICSTLLLVIVTSCQKSKREKNINEPQACALIESTSNTDDGGIIKDLKYAIENFSDEFQDTVLNCGDQQIQAYLDAQLINTRQFEYKTTLITEVLCPLDAPNSLFEITINKEGSFVGPELARDGMTEGAFKFEVPETLHYFEGKGSYWFSGNVDVINKNETQKIEVDATVVFEELIYDFTKQEISSSKGSFVLSGWLNDEIVRHDGEFTSEDFENVTLTLNKKEYFFKF